MKALSVKNPLSYFICIGLKDIENRSWTTKVRGTVYIHSSGYDCGYAYYPEVAELLPVHRTFNDIETDGYQEYHSEIIGYDSKADEFFLNNEKYRAEYEWLKKYSSDPEPALKAQAIIGSVDIVDVVTDSSSPWATRDSYHWVLENPKLFDSSVLNVKGKLRFWEYP